MWSHLGRQRNTLSSPPGPPIVQKRGVIAFSRSLPTITPRFLSSAHLKEMNTGPKPWTLHQCTLDMTRLHRRHTNSGNSVGATQCRSLPSKVSSHNENRCCCSCSLAYCCCDWRPARFVLYCSRSRHAKRGNFGLRPRGLPEKSTSENDTL